jgi:hypothetical protein
VLEYGRPSCGANASPKQLEITNYMLLRERILSELREAEINSSVAYSGLARYQRPDLKICRKKDIGRRLGRQASREGADYVIGRKCQAIKVKLKNARQFGSSPKRWNRIENSTKDGRSVFNERQLLT